jgi:hypothetical protein
MQHPCRFVGPGAHGVTVGLQVSQKIRCAAANAVPCTTSAGGAGRQQQQVAQPSAAFEWRSWCISDVSGITSFRCSASAIKWFELQV